MDYYSEANIPALALFRTRAEVLDASARLWNTDTPHKLRIGEAFERTSPWIGRVFSNYLEPGISKDAFLERWESLVRPHPSYASSDAEKSWLDLYRLYGKGSDSLDIERMVSGLYQGRPPLDFVVPEQQLPGPILSTVHASKGREAGHVVFMITPSSKSELDDDSAIEESRVCFVAFSRASETFHIEPGRHVRGQKHRERIIRKTRSKSGGRPSIQVHFGKKGDIHPTAHVEKEHWPSSEEDQRNLQDYLWDNAFTHVPLRARNSAGSNWKYHLYTKKEMSPVQCFGRLDDSVNQELFGIAKSQFSDGKKYRPGSDINYLYMVGATTSVIPKETDLRRSLIGPYSASGIFLTPVLFGFSTVFYQTYVGRRS